MGLLAAIALAADEQWIAAVAVLVVVFGGIGAVALVMRGRTKGERLHRA